MDRLLRPQTLLIFCAICVFCLLWSIIRFAPVSITWVNERTSVCKPRVNVVFLKTHKCASSTIQNIFFRYGDAHNLTFVLPNERNYLGHPLPFHHTMVPDLFKYNRTYNILAHHTRFNETEVKKVMSQDSVYVTVVRDPLELFTSLYSYYELDKIYRLKLENLHRVSLKTFEYQLTFKRLFGKLGLNQMLFDLGFSPKYFRNLTAISDFVNYTDSVFDLVMIADRMEESLVLLKDLMCWDYNDVIAFRHNARNDTNKNTLPPKVQTIIRNLNTGDEMLYRYFKHRLEDRIREFGKDKMAEEILELRRRTNLFYKFCVKKEMPMSKAQILKEKTNSRIITFLPSDSGGNETCNRMIFRELEYTEKLRSKQQNMYQNMNKKSF
ncbi:galactosylceramide sulfotransferase-like [Tachypleus tridentatus]|uniref:galactosylceramide sulfotransferase-like n=1 Tax=Tachypleus tridentatus TaxID=6853 RepID=UPI003FCFACC0